MKQILFTFALFSLTLQLSSSNLGSMKILSISGEEFEAEIRTSGLMLNQIDSIMIENSKNAFSKRDQLLDPEEIRVNTRLNNEITVINLSSDIKIEEKHFDFYLLIKTSNGTEIKRRYFGIIPSKRQDKSEFTKKEVTNKKFTVMDLSSCSELRDPNERLKCFDRSLGNENSNNDIYFTKKSGSLSQEEIEKNYFGKSGSDLEDSIERVTERSIPKSLGSIIVKVRKYNTDRYYLDLENGQTWKLIEPSRRKEFQKGKNIVIEKGRMGTFTVRLEGLNRKYTAKRIK